MLSDVTSPPLRATAEASSRNMLDAMTQLQQNMAAAMELTDSAAAQAAADVALSLDRLNDLAGQIAILTDENQELRTANHDLVACAAQHKIDADITAKDVLFAREDAARARSDQGRAEAEYATEHAARINAAAEQKQQAELAAQAELARIGEEQQRRAAQAQIDLQQAISTAYATGRAEVLATIPSLIEAAVNEGQSAGRHAVLNLLEASSSAMQDQPLVLVHSILADALTDEAFPSGIPPLLLDTASHPLDGS